MSEPAAWYAQEERGSTLGMRITVWLYRKLGRTVARLMVFPIVSYFYLTDAAGRRASRHYLERVYATPEGAQALGGPPGARHVFRNYLEFGLSILDRVGFWMGDFGDFEVRVHGAEHLERVVREKRGALVLGSHLGSFDAMRLLAESYSPIAVNLLMFTRHAARINSIFRQLSPGQEGGRMHVRVIPVKPGSAQHVLDARACIERGEVVAILADRAPLSERGHTARVKFLGESAPLPTGPIMFAALLRCPVLFMTGLRTGENRYEVNVVAFADPVEVERSRRREATSEYCQAYADLLARYCVRAPYQWFNFYEFWSGGEPNVGR